MMMMMMMMMNKHKISRLQKLSLYSTSSFAILVYSVNFQHSSNQRKTQLIF